MYFRERWPNETCHVPVTFQLRCVAFPLHTHYILATFSLHSINTAVTLLVHPQNIPFYD